MPVATEAPKAKAAKADSNNTVDKLAEMSDQMLEQVKGGQESAIEAVRKFLVSVDKALPLGGDEPSRRQEVIDSALEMSQKLAQTQYDFLSGVVHSASKTLGGTDSGK